MEEKPKTKEEEGEKEKNGTHNEMRATTTVAQMRATTTVAQMRATTTVAQMRAATAKYSRTHAHTHAHTHTFSLFPTHTRMRTNPGAESG